MGIAERAGRRSAEEDSAEVRVGNIVAAVVVGELGAKNVARQVAVADLVPILFVFVHEESQTSVLGIEEADPGRASCSIVDVRGGLGEDSLTGQKLEASASQRE